MKPKPRFYFPCILSLQELKNDMLEKFQVRFTEHEVVNIVVV